MFAAIIAIIIAIFTRNV